MKAIHFSMLTVVLMFAAAGCNPDRNGESKNVETQAAVVDTASVAPDSVSPEWNSQLDSMLRVAATAPQDTNLAELYFDIGEIYINFDYEKAKEYYLKMRDLNEQLDWNKGRHWFINGFSVLLARQSLEDSALIVLQHGLEWEREINNKKWIVETATVAGQIYNVKEWYETALQYYMEALPLCEQLDNPDLLGRLHAEIGKIYIQFNQFDKTLEHCEKAYALTPENLDVITNLARSYFYTEQYEKSIRHFEDALTLCKQQHNEYYAGYIYYQLGSLYLKIFDIDKAEKHARQAKDISEDVDFPDVYLASLIILGRLEEWKGNTVLSENHIKEALHISIERDNAEGQLECYKLLAELAAVQHNYRQSNQYWNQHDSLEFAMDNAKSLRAAAEMEAKYETEKKELEIERQQTVISRQQMLRNVLAGGVAVVVLIALMLWYMLGLRNRRNRALTELNDALAGLNSALAERNDALAEINTTKDKFFNIISHDIKNPAVAQRDALKILVQSAARWDAGRLEDYLNGLLETAEDQVELVYNLLGWAQLQTGRMVFLPAPFNLANGLRSDISLIRSMAEKKNISLTANVPADAVITGDSNMLATAVRNLLTNAVKFTSAGGTVALDVARTGTDSTAPEYTISVSDTGVGMTADQIDSLFRLDSAHSRPGTADEQGSGLGLIVCRELIEKHGSALHVESAPDSGSRFWFVV
ncbi:MAG: tetratricopeptide repeat-containing sensor histidine kinase [Tannerella sp.]|jgi:signal transduction histidine kinase|nr:tetratricopeptide repeat-containing sensor histidine kinase [Tannerella sp.]